MVDLEIDYTEDARWGWGPSGWRVSRGLAGRMMRVTTVAKVTAYSINEPIGAGEFR